MTTERLRVAVQKKGRLADQSLALLKSAGLNIQTNNSGLFYRVKNLPIDLLLVRDDDIPGLVSDGVADLGIVGRNVFEEFSLGQPGRSATVLRDLGFSYCRLCLAVPDGMELKGFADLEGKRIATSYPATLANFLKAQGVEATIVEMHGAVEVAPQLGISDLICDLVSSGATLEANNLTEVETILESRALLLQTEVTLSENKAEIAERLLERIKGVQASRETKYILLNAPKDAVSDITRLLPGSDAPTVIPLEGDGDLVAVHAVCRESVFWETMEKLKAVGASSILVMPIEKMMV